MDDFEKLINASDLIEWIMETYPDWCVGAIRGIVDHIDGMPSAQPEDKCGECDAWNQYKNYTKQPEIIRCNDCEHWDTSWENNFAPNYHYCPLIDGTRSGDFYCADAERRTDEQTD